MHIANKLAYPASLLVLSGSAYLLGRHQASPLALPKRLLYYQDPMHPTYHASRPGIAPDCGMPLVPVYAEESEKLSLSKMAGDTGYTRIDAATRQLYGIRTANVEERGGNGTIRVHGRVAIDDTRVFQVNSGTEGYVKETTGDAVGSMVAKDQHLALIYSPEFLSVAGGFLSANERGPGATPKDGGTATLNAAGANARADRLRTLGMSDLQIKEISETRKIPEDVYVLSPIDGFVLSRDISPGMRFEKHAEFYRIADLSHMWVFGEAFGADANAFQPGRTARVVLTDTGEAFTARVSTGLSQTDSQTRLLRPRLEVANPALHLRPGMYVEIELHVPGRRSVTVPADAILSTGTAKRVFVETREGEFEMRTVQTGWNDGDRVEILSGLALNEKVASSGTFLLDSESHLHR